MKIVFLILLVFFSKIVTASSGSVFLSASVNSEAKILTLSFLSNSNEDVEGTELSFTNKKTSQEIKVPLRFTVKASSDQTYTVAFPSVILKDLADWKIIAQDKKIKFSSFRMETPDNTAQLPDGWILQGEILRIKPGTYMFRENLIISKKLKIIFEPGVNLLLGKDVSVFLKGGITANSLSIRPMSSDVNWAGFIVNGYKEESSWKDVNISGGSDGQVSGIINSCSLCLYGGKHTIDHLKITDAKAEDALNAKEVSLKMVNSEFRNSTSDAFDCDFCQLEVDSGKFEDIGGDAIDVSSTLASITGNTISNVKDKAISVGEGSKARILKNTLTKSAIGVAIKDRSQANIDQNTFRSCQSNISAYRKKAFWEKGGSVSLGKNYWDKESKEIDEYSNITK